MPATNNFYVIPTEVKLLQVHAGVSVDSTHNVIVNDTTTNKLQAMSLADLLTAVSTTKANILLTGQTAAVGSVSTYTPAVDGTYLVGGNVNITAISAGSLALQVTYTDEANVFTTFTFVTGLSATGHNNPAPIIINVKASTAITIKTTFSGVSITYNVKGLIQAL